MTKTPTSRSEAQALDQADPLADRRSLFRMPEGVTYLVGHSLGPATHTALARLQHTAQDDWANGMVRSWNTAGWIDLAKTVGARLAPLIGVPARDVLIADSVSVNLFKLAGALLPRAASRTIFVEDDEFPTDQYIAKGLAGLSQAGFEKISAGQALDALSQGGVLIKSAVNYRSGEVMDIASYEAKARGSGAVIVWDLSHAAGVIPLQLADDGALFAAGCTYKYINGGPGAPAYLYAASSEIEALSNPMPGWLGHKEPFGFTTTYVPADGINRFTVGTPPILSLSALDGALDAFDGLSPSDVAEKARGLGDLTIARADELGLEVTSPRDRKSRGGHVSMSHPEGYAIVQALGARGILSDFRAPTTIRFGLSPLFLSYEMVWDTMDTLAEILRTEAWRDPAFQVRSKVT